MEHRRHGAWVKEVGFICHTRLFVYSSYSSTILSNFCLDTLRKIADSV
jgi:hypothetical protein